MLEKVIILLGCVFGIGSGALFYCTVDHLRLPAPIFVVVDLIGPLAGSIFVGLFSIPVVVGVFVFVIETVFAKERRGRDH
jgi:hypothetical protein